MTNIEITSLPRQAELAIFRALILATSSAVYIYELQEAYSSSGAEWLAIFCHETG